MKKNVEVFEAKTDRLHTRVTQSETSSSRNRKKNRSKTYYHSHFGDKKECYKQLLIVETLFLLNTASILAFCQKNFTKNRSRKCLLSRCNSLVFGHLVQNQGPNWVRPTKVTSTTRLDWTGLCSKPIIVSLRSGIKVRFQLGFQQ